MLRVYRGRIVSIKDGVCSVSTEEELFPLRTEYAPSLHRKRCFHYETKQNPPLHGSFLFPFFQNDSETLHALHHLVAHALGDGERVFAIIGEPHLGLEQEFVVFEATLTFSGPVAEFVAQDEPQGVLLGVAVGILGLHEDVEVLCLEVRGVAQMDVHVEVLHRILDAHLEGQRLVYRPFLVRDQLDVAVVGVAVAAAEQCHRGAEDEVYAFHSH